MVIIVAAAFLDNEIRWLTGRSDFMECVEWINERYQIPLILIRENKNAYPVA